MEVFRGVPRFCYYGNVQLRIDPCIVCGEVTTSVVSPHIPPRLAPGSHPLVDKQREGGQQRARAWTQSMIFDTLGVSLTTPQTIIHALAVNFDIVIDFLFFVH